MCIRDSIPIQTVPMTQNGKVDRNALPPLSATEKHPNRNVHPQALTTTELAIAALWRELLDVEDIGPLDNFLDLGGHSLMVMRAVALLETRHGISLNPRAFVFQTLQQIAAECDALATVATTDVTPGAGACLLYTSRCV